MDNLYERINARQYKRIFVVGDLHGCFDKLQQRLYEVQFDTKTDLLISVGDLIDRGTQNIECLEMLNEPWFKSVFGNHEVMALNAFATTRGTDEYDIAFGNWFMNGGTWFLDLKQPQFEHVLNLFTQVAKLPGIIEVTVHDKTHVICHADYPSNTYLFGKPIDVDKLVWSRERMVKNQNSRGTVIKGADQFYFGHTPTKDPKQFYNQNYIDTGYVFGGDLTLVQIK
jgi:serine/threonine protein phosphatase 1